MDKTTQNDVTPTSQQWQNWSENIIHKGNNYYFKPNNKTELQSILAMAKTNDVVVRVSGQRHSQPPLVTDDNRNDTPPANPEQYIIDMSCYIDIGTIGMEIGPGSTQVTLNTGISEDDLDAFLTNNNLMMETVTAGGFFSIGGMTAVDVHGATIDAPIFSETVSAFTIMNAEGEETVIDDCSKGSDGSSLIDFARVSLGAFGVVTRVTINVLKRPYANTIKGGHERYLLKDKDAFIQQYTELLTGPNKHTRMESFYTPYAAAPNVPFIPLPNFLTLYWDIIDDPSNPIPNGPAQSDTACALSDKGEYGAPYISGLAGYALKYVQDSQYFHDPYNPVHFPPVPTAGYVAIALDDIESQVNAANKLHLDLWLAKAARVMFMSYFIELPNLDKEGLSKVWDGLQAAGDYVIESGNFHIAAPMEFRFIKGGSTAMAGTFTKNTDSHFVNLDLIGFTDPTQGSDYPDELLKFFAMVERKWIGMGGLPHNGKMYGFYDPENKDDTSYTAPFNKNFLSFITQQRISNGAPIEAFKAFRAKSDPDNRFYNQYLQNLLGD